MRTESQSVLNPEVPSTSSAGFPTERVRASFPALTRPPGFIFFDNAAGAQVPQVVLDAVNHHLLEHNVQRGGRYAKSREVDEMVLRARHSVADLVNARDASEIAFGMNATSFIRLVSLAIGQTLDKRNEIVVTDLDHEANVATWLALERSGAKFSWWKVRDDGNLHVDDLSPLVSSTTRLVACTLASNALGSIVDAGNVYNSAADGLLIDGTHLRSFRTKQLHRGQAAACHPHDDDFASFEFHLSFRVVNANNAMTRPAIQNRAITLDSAHPNCSK